MEANQRRNGYRKQIKLLFCIRNRRVISYIMQVVQGQIPSSQFWICFLRGENNPSWLFSYYKL